MAIASKFNVEMANAKKEILMNLTNKTLSKIQIDLGLMPRWPILKKHQRIEHLLTMRKPNQSLEVIKVATETWWRKSWRKWWMVKVDKVNQCKDILLKARNQCKVNQCRVKVNQWKESQSKDNQINNNLNKSNQCNKSNLCKNHQCRKSQSKEILWVREVNPRDNHKLLKSTQVLQKDKINWRKL